METKSTTNKTSVKLVAYGIFALLLIGVVLLALEVYMRFQPDYGRAGFRYDPELFYRLTPGLTAQKPYAWGKEGREPFVLRFNDYGFRGPTPATAKAEGTIRIMVLGDSYTAGLDYPDDEIFTSQLQQQLKAAGIAAEVINASCPAWGTDQQYLFWRNEGRALKPDWLVVVSSPNDLREMWNKGLIRLNEGNELTIKSPVIPAKERFLWGLSTRSSLYQYAQQKILKTEYGNFLRVFGFYPVNFGFRDSTDWDMPLYLTASFPDLDQSYVLYQRLLQEMQTDLKSWGGQMALVKIPTRYEFDSTYVQPDLSAQVVETRMAALSSQLGIPFLNLNESLRRDTTASPARIFMDWEYHFDKDGHDFVAAQLSQFMLPFLKK